MEYKDHKIREKEEKVLCRWYNDIKNIEALNRETWRRQNKAYVQFWAQQCNDGHSITGKFWVFETESPLLFFHSHVSFSNPYTI